jgi:small subunit ribosomal protein S10
MAKKREKKEEKKIRVKVKGYDPKIVDKSIEQIIEVIEDLGGEFLGPVPLPTEIKRITVRRSPFVHKDAREQFEIRIHKRFLEIKKVTKEIVEALQKITLPTGVEIEIKIL